jgi:hypothetical protein
VTYAAFDRLGHATGSGNLGLGQVAAQTVEQALAAWPAIADRSLRTHPDIRAAIERVMLARADSLSSR